MSGRRLVSTIPPSGKDSGVSNRRHFVLISFLAANLLCAPPFAIGADSAKIVSASSIQTPDALRQAISHGPCRLANDKTRDAGRKPAETMAFYGVKPGMKVAELIAGEGYFSGVLAAAVGPTGTVYGQNNKSMRDYALSQGKGASPLAAVLAQPGCKNIVELNSELDNPMLPDGLDAVFIVMIYHDVIDQKWNSAAMNAAILKALKPGGIYGVIDHRAAPGAGITDVGKNHRIEEKVVISEVEKAGFRLAERTDLLANPKDPLNVPVFQENMHDHTDRFTLKFVKP